MAINLEYAPGATPLDPDEAEGLVPSHITNHAQLNEWELANILAGERWAFARKRPNLLDPDFVRRLHKEMFGNTWRWAGTYRTTEKNIGVDPTQIATRLHDLCEDVKTQVAKKSFPIDEIATRFSHRMVAIHPFPNGNGRFSRTIADLLLVQHGAEQFTWGAASLVVESEVRQRYLDALRAADRGDYGLLLGFVRT